MQSTRKRRVASLTASAIVSIQMNDSSSRRKSTSEKGVKTRKSSGSLSRKSRARSSQSQQKRSAPKRTDVKSKGSSSSSSDVKQSSNGSKHTEKRNKPTASVVPVKKSEHSMEWPSSSIPVLENSHLLLVPVSMNNVLSSVPVLALPSPVNLKLVNCFGSSSSPIVNVCSLFAHPHPHAAQRIVQNRRYSHQSPEVKFLHNVSTSPMTACQSQTEPLNLKLGESSIPSYKTAASKPLKQDGFNMSRNITKFSSKGSSKSLISRGHLVSLHQKEVKKKSEEKYEFSSYSPSSESSYSSESDAVSQTHRKVRKKSIDLRSKAAGLSSRTVVVNNSLRSRSYSENNAWTWEGNPYHALVYSVSAKKPVLRCCYPCMRRKGEHDVVSSTSSRDGDDVVMVRDCVVLRAHMSEEPYIAKVVALWQEPCGNMMISLLWYYRPEHTEDPKVRHAHCNNDELFASRHLDEISVACVEEKCYVLSYNEYCRYRASHDGREDYLGMNDSRTLLPTANGNAHSSPHPDIDYSLVFFCKRYYDVKSRRLLKQFPPPVVLYCNSLIREEKLVPENATQYPS